MKNSKISVVINTRNEAKYLTKCLSSVKDFAYEIIVVDMHSTDDSVKIAKSFGAKVYYHKWMPVVEQARNFALKKAQGPWILLLDPDEYLTRPLKKELLRISQRKDIDFVRLPRKNIIFGKWIRHSRWWPDYIIRFFKKGSVKWQKEVHSQPITSGNGISLFESEQLAIRHQHYDSIEKYLTWAIRYSARQAEELQKENYRVRISDLLVKPTSEFCSRFFAATGYKDGLHGLVLAILQAFSIALIYIQLWQMQGFKPRTINRETLTRSAGQSILEYLHWQNHYLKKESNNKPSVLLSRFKHFLVKLIKP
jgi:(heptosyl)LPS beta-1,4-glucosyltransferase